MFAAYSGKVALDRWDLGVLSTLEAAVDRVQAFERDPGAMRRKVHRVLAEATTRRR